MIAGPFARAGVQRPPYPRLRGTLFSPLLLAVVLGLVVVPRTQAASTPGMFDVKTFGATGDGRTLDTTAIQRAIDAATAQGGGTVVFPSGSYLSYSLQLRSHVTLDLSAGAKLIAAEPSADLSHGYDAPEPNPGNEAYQDFGHSHWHNSLIWAEDAEDITIRGGGTISGLGLSRGTAWARRDLLPAERAVASSALAATNASLRIQGKAAPETAGNPDLPAGIGNKAIAFKNCRHVVLQDFTLFHGGHFAILATGVDNLTFQRLRIDSNRDGMDLDNCRDARVSDCVVNTPFDDAICIKSSLALGVAQSRSEAITIDHCQVSGFEEGTLLDGTLRRGVVTRSVPTGRIKCGTESNGPMRAITISHCVFTYSRGLALESVDGSDLEDITVTNLTMREITNAPIFVRLGGRMRAPPGTPLGHVRRISLSNIVADHVAATSGILIAGLPEHPIEDLRLSHCSFSFDGGGTTEQSRRVVPEYAKEYPDPKTFGIMPAWGLWARHIRGLGVNDVVLRAAAKDERPAVQLDDAVDTRFASLHLPAENLRLRLQRVNGLILENCPGLPNARLNEMVTDQSLP